MSKNKYKVIGVMSGTSLDGIDIAYVTFEYQNKWHYNIECAQTIPYPEFWRQQLEHLSTKSLEKIKDIDDAYTIFLAETIESFLIRHGITDLDAICSHGHTALHLPEKGMTYQIGNQQHLPELLHHTVVCDFRVQDVALGGQGAPLVPIGDELLFNDYDYCLNLGGFSNLSTKENGYRIAFDICPVNTVLNHYATHFNVDYDPEGAIARTGAVYTPLLLDLNALDYYKKPYPKSLGMEWVQEHVFPLIQSYKLRADDILRTFVEHIALQIGRMLNGKPGSTVFITGGGAYNAFLIQRLQHHTDTKIVIPTDAVINFKEALIFGLLGVLRLRDEINCLSSVTGASKDHSSGVIFSS